MRLLNHPEQIDLFMERQWDGIWILPCKWGRVLKECDHVCNCPIHLIITDSRTLEPFMRVGALSLVELLVGTPWVHTSEASERPVAHRPSQEVVFARGPLLMEQKIAIHLLDRWDCMYTKSFLACPNYISVVSLTYYTRIYTHLFVMFCFFTDTHKPHVP